METIELKDHLVRPDTGFSATLLLEQGRLKARRIELARGARIPPCQMEEDVVFVVLTGKVTFRAEELESQVTAPGAVFIPGGATTRTMEAQEDSLVLAVLSRPAPDDPIEGAP